MSARFFVLLFLALHQCFIPINAIKVVTDLFLLLLLQIFFYLFYLQWISCDANDDVSRNVGVQSSMLKCSTTKSWKECFNMLKINQMMIWLTINKYDQCRTNFFVLLFFLYLSRSLSLLSKSRTVKMLTNETPETHVEWEKVSVLNVKPNHATFNHWL